MTFERAIVRPPGTTFADGLTTAGLGPPDPQLALAQHEAYVRALETCGLSVTRLPADDRFPDSTFVEDTAVLARGLAVLCRPGAPSRAGEVDAIRPALLEHYSELEIIEAPGHVDGGDICDADGHFLIGISARTNPEGAAQLAARLERRGYTSATIDIRDRDDILHRKSGLSALGDNRLAVIEPLADHPALEQFEHILVPQAEAYAANCIRVNDRVLIPAGFPRLCTRLRDLGYAVVEVEMSEFRKMDGGLSCLSLRFLRA